MYSSPSINLNEWLDKGSLLVKALQMVQMQ